MKTTLILTALLLMTGCADMYAVATGTYDPGVDPYDTSYGSSVIPASECIGAVVNGTCHGSATPGAQIKIDTGQYPTCYGQMIGGVCTGPQF